MKNPLKPKTLKLNSKWGNKSLKGLKAPIQSPKNIIQVEALDVLDLLEDDIIPKKVNFRRLLVEETDTTITKTKTRADERLLKSAKVLERMVIQDANIDITFG